MCKADVSKKECQALKFGLFSLAPCPAFPSNRAVFDDESCQAAERAGDRRAQGVEGRQLRTTCITITRLAAPLILLMPAQLVSSGERERLKKLAKERLEESGWTDEVRQLCRGRAAEETGWCSRPSLSL